MVLENFRTKKKLIAILPETAVRNSELSRKIRWIVDTESCDVLYLMLRDQSVDIQSFGSENDDYLEITRGTSSKVAIKYVSYSKWLNYLRQVIQPEDLIFCQSEQPVQQSWRKLIPLADFLQSEFPNRVVQISGACEPTRQRLMRLGSQIIFLLGCLVIIGSFTALEIPLDHALPALLKIPVLCMVVCIEFASVYGWNRIFNL